MIIPAQEIRKRARAGMIDPFVERTAAANGMSFGLSSAGYDIRICESLSLPPKDFVLASSMERFEIPVDLIAFVYDKSTWARRGLSLFNTVIEPGWRGYLTLELHNSSSTAITILCGDPIAQIVFQQLSEPTEQPYEGKYQDQPPGAVPPIYSYPKR